MKLRGLKYFQTQVGWDEYVKELAKVNINDHKYGVALQFKTGTRTTKQNSAMHLYFTMLATALNDAGLDMKKVLKPEVEIPWSTSSVKDFLWRPIQKIITKKKSTTQLERDEINKVYEPLDRHLLDKFSVSVPFPNHDWGDPGGQP